MHGPDDPLQAAVVTDGRALFGTGVPLSVDARTPLAELDAAARGLTSTAGARLVHPDQTSIAGTLAAVARAGYRMRVDLELDRARLEYNTVRLHAGIGYVTPDDEHQGRGEAIRKARQAGLEQTARIRTHVEHDAGRTERGVQRAFERHEGSALRTNVRLEVRPLVRSAARGDVPHALHAVAAHRAAG